MSPTPKKLLLCLAGAALCATVAAAATPLTTVLFVNGLTKPVWAGSPPGDNHRLFVVEQKTSPSSTGKIRIVKDGVLLATPYFTVTGNATGNEQGLLGMCFDPNWQTNGVFYTSRTKSSGGMTLVDRIVVTDPTADTAGSVTVTNIFSAAQPASNHNGGGIAIGPDGNMWIPLGDGGSENDPNCLAQKSTSLMGKLFRIDPVTGAAAAGNPVLPGFDSRIWSIGWRNPWRWSFDRANGDLYVGDVGQDAIEEIDYTAWPNTGGQNYGWKIQEGNNCFSVSACPAGTPACHDVSLTNPIHTLAQSGTGACAIMGGYVYRGCAIPDLQGTYFFADYCNNHIYSFVVVAGTKTNFLDRTTELTPSTAGKTISSIVSFGEDNKGEIYIVDQNGGEIFKIVPALSVPAPSADLGNGKIGGNGLIPTMSTCGLLTVGNTCELNLENGPASKLALLCASTAQNNIPLYGGTFVPDTTVLLVVALGTDANGKINLVIPGGGGPISAYAQYLIDDPAAVFGVGMSNALRLDIQP